MNVLLGTRSATQMLTAQTHLGLITALVNLASLGMGGLTALVGIAIIGESVLFHILTGF